MESLSLNEINQKIFELKKRVLLAEGKKSAISVEWERQNHINSKTLENLKDDIKSLSNKYVSLQNPTQIKNILFKSTTLPNAESGATAITKQEEKLNSTDDSKRSHSSRRLPHIPNKYTVNYKNIEDAIFTTDLKITANRKQIDLLQHRFKCRKQYFIQLLEKYHELKSRKEHHSSNSGENPCETLEEVKNRKLICQLENDIHRANVQRTEAEHIKKKYKAIESSLSNDAKRYENALNQIEMVLKQQQLEIQKLRVIHDESIEMRNAAKMLLQQQELQGQQLQKSRQRQATNSYKQVEQRKLELEHIGRKLFFEGRSLHHQDSLGSNTTDQMNDKTQTEDGTGDNEQLKQFAENYEELFRNLMIISGATTIEEVLQRFYSQKESSKRLNYLRNSAVLEKNYLESYRIKLTKDVEASKFLDKKSTETNQEAIEEIKNKISKYKAESEDNLTKIEGSTKTINFLRQHIINLVSKLQKVDESAVVLTHRDGVTIQAIEISEFLQCKANNQDMIEILKFKISKCKELIYGKQSKVSVHETLDHKILEEDQKLLSILPDSVGKTPLLPLCYTNIFIDQTQSDIGALPPTPDHPNNVTAVAEEESDIPSRNYLKTQSSVIVEQKSKRKSFRPTSFL